MNDIKTYTFLNNPKWYRLENNGKYYLNDDAPIEILDSYKEYCWDYEISKIEGNTKFTLEFKNFINYLEKYYDDATIFKLLINMTEQHFLPIEFLHLYAQVSNREIEIIEDKYDTNLNYHFFVYDDEFRKEVEEENYLLNGINKLELSVRAYNALKKHNINTYKQLIELKDTDIIGIKNIGAKTLNEIINKKKMILNDLGISEYDENIQLNDENDVLISNIDNHSNDIDYDTLVKLLMIDNNKQNIESDELDRNREIESTPIENYDFENFFSQYKKDRSPRELQQLIEFCNKWIITFKDIKVDKYYILEGSFGDECKYLKFKMDCGESFISKYKIAYDDNSELRKIIKEITDIDLLGSALFSKWRYYNHWADSYDDILLPKNRTWFIMILRRIKELSENIKD